MFRIVLAALLCAFFVIGSSAGAAVVGIEGLPTGGYLVNDPFTISIVLQGPVTDLNAFDLSVVVSAANTSAQAGVDFVVSLPAQPADYVFGDVISIGPFPAVDLAFGSQNQALASMSDAFFSDLGDPLATGVDIPPAGNGFAEFTVEVLNASVGTLSFDFHPISLVVDSQFAPLVEDFEPETIAAVPEPAGLTIWTIGLAAVVCVTRRRRTTRLAANEMKKTYSRIGP